MKTRFIRALGWRVVTGLWMGMAGAVSAETPAPSTWRDTYAEMRGDQLLLGNRRIRRTFNWNNGHLASVSLTDVQAGKDLVMQAPKPDLALGKLPGKALSGTWKAEVVEASLGAAHLQVEVSTSFEALEVRRVFRVYPDCPAIACDVYLRAGEKALPDFKAQDSVLQQLSPPGAHWRYRAVEFFDRTDGNNNLVRESEVLAFTSGGNELPGNLLFGESVQHDTALFLVKEAPCSFVQLNHPGHDFQVSARALRAVGMGVSAGDLPPGEWVRVYGLATGVCGKSEQARLSALRNYQKNLRLHRPDRDDMILMNTWGDRNRDANVGEAFVRKEVDACSRLGVTHLQIDDGWQQGLSSNSAQGGGKLWDLWDEEHWQPHAERFPNGFPPVVEVARSKGVDLGLWFHPSNAEDYKHWQRDADILLNLYRNFGIRTFKIDGIKLPTKRAEINLRRFFDRIAEESKGEVVVNLDATADNRTGYHYFQEYGNIFLENRYTDWGNYYPYQTLRNLWMLSRYVPPERLQIEFLNKWRRPDRYAPDDPLAPQRLPFDYVAAVTLMAQPLAWFEGSGLPEEAFDQAAPVLKAYRKHQAAIHQGTILPIGGEPSGTGWTGFQSISDDEQGYLAIYREFNEIPRAAIRLYGLNGRLLVCEPVCGDGAAFTSTVAENGDVLFSLPAPHSFALYHYRARDRSEKKNN